MLAKVSKASGTVGEENRVGLEADSLSIQTNGFFVILASEQAVSFGFEGLSSLGTFLYARKKESMTRVIDINTSIHHLPLGSMLQWLHPTFPHIAPR